MSLLPDNYDSLSLTIGVASLVVSLIGLVVAGIAYRKSDSAKRAVTEALGRRDAQDDLDRIVRFVSVLKSAKESVTPWIPRIPQEHDADQDKGRAGRHRGTDLIALRDAATFLRTYPPLEADESLQSKINQSADQLNNLAERIGQDLENECLWNLALLALSDLIPFFERTVRMMKNKLVEK